MGKLLQNSNEDYYKEKSQFFATSKVSPLAVFTLRDKHLKMFTEDYRDKTDSASGVKSTAKVSGSKTRPCKSSMEQDDAMPLDSVVHGIFWIKEPFYFVRSHMH